MVRFSDFLNEDKPQAPPSRQPDHGASPVTPATPARPAQAQPPKPLAPEAAKPTGSTEAVFYDHLLGCVITLCSQLRANQLPDLAEAAVLVDRLPKLLAGSRGELVLSWVSRQMPEHYLYGHSVNVAILSAFIATGLGYPQPVVQQLGMAGLIADLGIVGAHETLTAAPRPLTESEKRQLEAHAVASSTLFEASVVLSSDAREAVLAHHERLDGSGYPNGLRDAAVPEYARIVAVADVYDAMTHTRPHRRRLSPAEALKVLIAGSDKQFDRRPVKVLVDEFSLYPPGSAVRLNTNEVGVVQKVHREAPLRPLVLISRDANQNVLPSPRTVNLLEHPFIYVKEIVPEQE